MQVYIRTPDSSLHSLNIPSILDSGSLYHLKTAILEKTGISQDDQTLILNGKILYSSAEVFRIKSGSTIDLHLGLSGGKGGFGSLLRGQAIAKRKITNFDSSRDLQGRRIRNVTLHKKMMEWVKKKKEEDEKIQAEIDEFKEQKKNTLRAQSDIKLKQEFKDKIEQWESELSKSVKEGAKRKPAKPEDSNETSSKTKKKIHTNEKAVSHEDFISSKLTKILISNESDNTAPASKEKTTFEAPAKKEALVEPPKKVEYAEIDLTKINSLEELNKLGPDHIKNELNRLGLKSGGNPQERAQRLYDIKLNPNLLFHPKYIAKK